MVGGAVLESRSRVLKLTVETVDYSERIVDELPAVEVGHSFGRVRVAGYVRSARPPAIAQPPSPELLVNQSVHGLERLRDRLAELTPQLMNETLGSALVDDRSFAVIADSLRLIEGKLRKAIERFGSNGFSRMLRAAAEARSAAALNDSIIRSYTTVPEVYESRISKSELGRAVQISSDRLLKSVE